MTRQSIDLSETAELRVCFAGVPNLARGFEVFLHMVHSPCINDIHRAIKTQKILGFRIKSSQLFSHIPTIFRTCDSQFLAKQICVFPPSAGYFFHEFHIHLA
jgi:hypothetical protein